MTDRGLCILLFLAWLITALVLYPGYANYQRMADQGPVIIYKTDTLVKQCPFEHCKDHSTLTTENLMAQIDLAGIKHPLAVFSQAMWETGNLKCDSCSLDDNNLFGFQTDSAHYIYFGSWQESVYYYARWQRRKYKGGDYFNFLAHRWGAKNPEEYKAAIRKKTAEYDAFGTYK